MAVSNSVLDSVDRTEAVAAAVAIDTASRNTGWPCDVTVSNPVYVVNNIYGGSLESRPSDPACEL